MRRILGWTKRLVAKIFWTKKPKRPEINVWLDDMRAAPEGWVHAKTVDEAFLLLGENEVAYMSLDHDLGDGPTGKALVMMMIETGKWPKHKPTVHSQDPYGRYCMLELIERYGPYDGSQRRG